MHINSQNLKFLFFPSWAPVGSIDTIILANQTEIFEQKINGFKGKVKVKIFGFRQSAFATNLVILLEFFKNKKLVGFGKISTYV